MTQQCCSRAASHALMPYPDAPVEHARKGALAELSFCVEDVFDIAGFPTSAGNASVLAASGIKTATAPAAALLLSAGARFAGKALASELGLPFLQENIFFGTPVNGRHPQCFAGASGCASAVSCGLCDIGLGIDCCGSLCACAAQCALFGLRTSSQSLPLELAISLGAPFCAVGLTALRPEAFFKTAEVLLSENKAWADSEATRAQLLIPVDILTLFGPETFSSFEPVLQTAQKIFGPARFINLSPCGLEQMLESHRALLAQRFWRVWGGFIEKERPQLGPLVKDYAAFCFLMSSKQAQPFESVRESVAQHIDNLLNAGGIILAPTLPMGALPKTASENETALWQTKLAASFCLNDLTETPRITLPLSQVGEKPCGVSLICARSCEDRLLACSRRLYEESLA